MPRSLQQTEDAILRGDVVIDANPITNWCSSNAAIEADAQNNRWLVKKRLRGRIDGVVSMAMGMGISLAGLEEAREKTYQMLVL
jgi:phage terminase large subunit-like protein